MGNKENPDELVIEEEESQVVEPGANEADTETETAEAVAEGDSTPEETKVVDTETETAEETEKPVDPLQQRFDELGLGGQYASPTEVLERVGDSNRYLDALEKANKQQQRELDRLREIERQQQQSKLTPEQLRERLDVDPAGAMAEAGFARTENMEQLQGQLDAIEQRQRRQDVANSIAQYPELQSVASAYRLGREPVRGSNQLWDHMTAAMAEYPGLDTAPIHTILAVLHPVAKARLAASQRAPIVPVSEQKKAEANTNAGKPAGGTSDKPDFSKMSAEAIQRYYEEHDMVGP